MIQQGFDVLNALSGGGGAEKVRATERPEAERSFSSVLGDAQRGSSRPERGNGDKPAVRSSGEGREATTRSRGERPRADENKGRTEEAGERDSDLTDAVAEGVVSEAPKESKETNQPTANEGEAASGSAATDRGADGSDEARSAVRVQIQGEGLLITEELQKAIDAVAGESDEETDADETSRSTADAKAADLTGDAGELIGDGSDEDSNNEAAEKRGEDAALASAAAAQRADRAAAADAKQADDRSQQSGKAVTAAAGQDPVEAATEQKNGATAQGEDQQGADESDSGRGRAAEANRALSAFSDRSDAAGQGVGSGANQNGEVALGRVDAGGAGQVSNQPGVGLAGAAGVQGDGETTNGQDQRVADQAARALRAAVNQRGGTVTMRLNPPELGSLRVELRLEQNTVKATFDASTEQARTALTQHLSALKTSLQSHGLSVESLTVQNSNSAGNEQLARDGGDGPDDGRSRGSFDRSGGGDGEGRDNDEHREMFEQELVDLMA